MGLSAPWNDSYLNNCFEPPNFHHQTFSFKTFFYFTIHLSQSKNTDNSIPVKTMSCMMMIYINKYTPLKLQPTYISWKSQYWKA